MHLLNNDYRYVVVESTPRLSELYLYYAKINQALNNIWFNKNKKLKLKCHLQKIGVHQKWLLNKTYDNCIASNGVAKILGKKQFKIRLLVKK